MNQNIIAMYKVDDVKSWITPQGFIAGFNAARLFNMEHEVFHNRLYNYYHSPYGPQTNQPIIYRMDKGGHYLPTCDSFPYDLTTMRADLGSPTFGITSKHLLDLYMEFGEKHNEIEMLIQALMNVILVSEGTSADAYIQAKQCVCDRKDFVYDFVWMPELSVEDAEELFGKILIQDGLPSVKYRNLTTQNFDKVAKGIQQQFSVNYSDGISGGIVKEVLPAIVEDDKILWREIKMS